MAYDVWFGKRILLYAINHPVLPDRLRMPLLRRAGVKLGARAIVRSGAHLESTRLTLGDDVFVNHGLFFDGNARADIGDRSAIGPQVRLLTATHELAGPDERAGRAQSAPIAIGKGCWLGGGVTVLPGVSIASGCVVAAGAVVTCDTEADGLYAGVPARRLRDL